MGQQQNDINDESENNQHVVNNDDVDDVDDVQPSPLGHPTSSTRESSVVRKETNHNITGCAQGVNDGLDGMLKHLKAALPSPAVNNANKENTKKRPPSNKKQTEPIDESPAPPTRRRSARIAKKHKSRSKDDDDEEQNAENGNDSDAFANISIRKRTRRKNKSRESKENSKESTPSEVVSSGNDADEEEEHPYIDDD